MEPYHTEREVNYSNRIYGISRYGIVLLSLDLQNASFPSMISLVSSS